MNKFLGITLSVLVNSNLCFSQGGVCGTYISKAQDSLEKTFTITPLIATQSLPQVNRDLSLALYIVKDSTGNAGIIQSDIDAALVKLNSYFAPISLKFHWCTTVYINNYQLDNLTAGNNEKDLTVSYSTPYVINLYLVSTLTDIYKNSVKGLSYMPGDKKNFIYITKENFNTSEIGHQFGHFFNLYHTHETYFGNELVNNSATCATTGDLCCDTKADPTLSEGLVDNNCLYTGKIKDSNNQFFTPSVKNMMSFSNKECRCFFSQTQYLRVIYTLEHLKSTLK
jgi:hypothetical protein